MANEALYVDPGIPQDNTAAYVKESGSNSSCLAIGKNRVGIGTTSPGSPLDVNGNIMVTNSNSNRYLVHTPSDGNYGLRFVYDAVEANRRLDLNTDSAERISIMQGGNVGIGTTSPGGKLHIYEEGDEETLLKLHRVSTGVGQWLFNVDGGTGDLEINNSTRDVMSLNNTGDVVFNEDGGDHDFRVEGVGQANAIFVQGSEGKVGIRTNDFSKGEISLYGNTYLGGALNVFDVLDVNANQLNVGIGTSPDANYKLDVNGNIKASGGVQLGDPGDSPGAGAAGMIRYKSGRFQGWTGSSWVYLDA